MLFVLLNSLLVIEKVFKFPGEVITVRMPRIYLL